MIDTSKAVLSVFLSGALTLGYGTAALYFWRFWRQTGDWLFRNFAWALLALMAERFFLLSLSRMNEFRPFVYSIRLLAFVLILTAILRKNWRRTAASGQKENGVDGI